MLQLPGEVPGTVRTPDEPEWTVVDLATNGFGQGIAVTPLQMLNAVAAIGNDGVLMRPTIVKQIDGPDGIPPDRAAGDPPGHLGQHRPHPPVHDGDGH